MTMSPQRRRAANPPPPTTATHGGRRTRTRLLAVLGLVVTVLAGLVTTQLPATAASAPDGIQLSAAASLDDGDSSLVYSGRGWDTCTRAWSGCNLTASLERYRFATTAGDTVTLRFTGTGVRLFAFKEPQGGIGSVRIDGVSRDVDYYARSQTLTEVFSAQSLTSGDHTLTLSWTGRRGSGSSANINLDRIEITDGVASASPTPTTSTPAPTTAPSTSSPAPTTPTTPSTTTPSTTTPPTTTAPTTGTPSTGGRAWLSGGSGAGMGDGSFGAWRGSPTPIATTWSDTDFDNASHAYQFYPGQDYQNWTGSIDWSPGALWGASWSTAASGALDDKWIAMMKNARSTWTSKSRGTFYIRFAHEMNGNWFQHSVRASEINDFKTAWQRMARIKQTYFPEAKLVFNTNANTVQSPYYDWRQLWPGDAYVDVYATDFYSQHWKFPMFDGTGAPLQLEAHRQFAAAHGKPFAVPEWGINMESGGDQPAYIQFMYDFFSRNGGTGGGKLLYECYFNYLYANNQYSLFPSNRTRAPQSAALYQKLF